LAPAAGRPSPWMTSTGGPTRWRRKGGITLVEAVQREDIV
jgi:hypothetical protein